MTNSRKPVGIPNVGGKALKQSKKDFEPPSIEETVVGGIPQSYFDESTDWNPHQQ